MLAPRWYVRFTPLGLGLIHRLQEASSADPAAEAGPATNVQPLSKFEKLRKRKNQGIQGLGLFLAVGFSAAYRRAHAGCHALAGCLVPMFIA